MFNRFYLIGYLFLASVLMYNEYPMIISILLIAWGFISISGHLDERKIDKDEQANNIS